MNQDLLNKYIAGDCSQEEKVEVAKWLKDSDDNRSELSLQRDVYNTSIWNDSNSFLLSKNDTEQQTEKISPKRFSLLTEILKVAACLLIGVGAYHFLLRPYVNPIPSLALQAIYSPEGQRTEIILSDGSKVWLNAKSTLTFPSEFSEDKRVVQLDGEAYFDVAHDAEKQFIVKTDLCDVKVHGTEFNVSAYNNTKLFETALINGSVEVLLRSSNQSLMLKPNNRIYYADNQLKMSGIESMDQFLWKKGVLYFEDMKVKDLLRKLELYYDVQFEVKNKNILEHQYTGKFWTKDGVEHVLKVLQLGHDFKYTKQRICDLDTINKIIIY